MGYGKAEKGQRAVMDYYFQTEGYSVVYDGKPLIRQIEIGIQKGEILTLIGPNGAGKSTTMNMITGYLAPTAGTVKVDGFDIVKEPEKAKEHIGYLPEIPPLYSEMTVEGYLNYAAE